MHIFYMHIQYLFDIRVGGEKPKCRDKTVLLKMTTGPRINVGAKRHKSATFEI